MLKKFICRTADFSSEGLSLRPFILYGIEIRRIRRKIFQEAASSFNRLLNPLRFMELGVVHDSSSSLRRHRQKALLQPCLKNVRVDAAIEQRRSQQPVSGQCAASTSSHVSHPFRRITGYPRHVLGKTAFININQRNARQFINADLFFEESAGLLVSLLMGKIFFHG